MTGNNNEIWKDIPGYEGRYQASSLGRIRNIRTGRVRKDVMAGHGYRAIQLSNDTGKHRLYVHRIIAATFLGMPEYDCMQVNHKNLDKNDNRACNLEWVTKKENMAHAYANGAIDYRRKRRSDNKSGVSGIYLHRGHYEVTLNGKYLGYCKTLEEATRIRKDAEAAYERQKDSQY